MREGRFRSPDDDAPSARAAQMRRLLRRMQLLTSGFEMAICRDAEWFRPGEF
jgi:hypothetical protein